MNLGKRILLTIMIVVSFVALGIDAWYIYMLNTAPSKIVAQSFNVGYQQIIKTDGTTEEKPFIEVNLFDNVFELKFNYVRDENEDAFYSKGVQYVASTDKGLDFELNYSNPSSYNLISTEMVADKVLGFYTLYENYYRDYNFIYQDTNFKNLNTYQYASGDDYETTLNNELASPLTQDTLFRVQIGDKLYGMKLKGDRIYYDYSYKFDGGLEKQPKENLDNTWLVKKFEHTSSEPHHLHSHFYFDDYFGYAPLDINYFAKVLYNSVSGLEKGTSQDILFNFGDFFDYYEYDGSSYGKVSLDGDIYNKIVKDIQSYYVIRVNVNDGEMIESSQSIMGMLNGSANINPNGETGNYIYGKTIINAEFNETVRDFDLVQTNEVGVYKFVLKLDFKNYYDEYINDIVVNVVIDEVYLSSCGIIFGGFDESSFGNFEITGVENYA